MPASSEETRILTADETARRRREQATSTGARIVALCSRPDCPRAAFNGPWCVEHRPGPSPLWPAARDFSDEEYTRLRAAVEADAAPIFVLAMNWIARQQVAHLGLTLDGLAASIDRIHHELENPR